MLGKYGRLHESMALMEELASEPAIHSDDAPLDPYSITEFELAVWRRGGEENVFDYQVNYLINQDTV